MSVADEPTDSSNSTEPAGTSQPLFSPEDMLLEANIREFGHTISLICALETGGKLNADEAYTLIKKTWSELKLSRKSLFGDNGKKSKED